jgi:tetratricopeptide (TPR) repeat protein
MAHRRIAEVDVSRAIATRVASVQGNRRPGDDVGDDNDKPRQASGLSIGQIMTAALEFLSAGRRTAAAALFEAAKRSNPNDAEVRNNYGFCILPDHPEEGLQEIHVGSELGFDRRDITLANRMYGLFRLHRFASALEAAERLFLEEENDHKAYLWDWRKDADNATILNVDARHYGVEFALDIAHLVGDISQINLWSNRADSLGLSFGD